MPSVKPGESQKDYVGTVQAAAICYSLFKKHESIEDLVGRMNQHIQYLEEKCKKKKKVVSESNDQLKAKLEKEFGITIELNKKGKMTYWEDEDGYGFGPKDLSSHFTKKDVAKFKPLLEAEKRPRCNWKGCTKPATRMSADDYPLCDKHYKMDLETKNP